MIVTDVVDLTAGAKEFIYVCKKQPFAISCSPYMPKLPETYVDLDLVLKLNIPMKNLQCTRMNLSGQFTRIVGQISQTVQCVVSGQAVGTSHLKAKVVRDLSKLFRADCLASKQLYDKLMQPSIQLPRKKKQTGISDEYSNVSVIIENSADDASNTSEECYDATEEFEEKYDDAELAQISSPAQDVAHFHRRAEYEDLSKDLSQYIEYEGPSYQPTGHYVHNSSRYHPCGAIKGSLESPDMAPNRSSVSSTPARTGMAPSGSPPAPAPPTLLPAEQNHARAPVPSQPCIPKDEELELLATHGYRGDQVLDAEQAILAQHGYDDDLVQDADEDMLLAYHGYPPAVRPQPWHPLAASLHPGPRDVHIAALNAATNSNLSLSQSKYQISSLSRVDVHHEDQVMIDHGYPPAHVTNPTYAELGRLLALHHGYPEDQVQHADLDMLLSHHRYPPDVQAFCPLCKVCNKPPSVFLSHNLCDPLCPSNESDDDFEEEDQEEEEE